MERYTWAFLMLLFLQLQGSASSEYNTDTLEAPRDLQLVDPGHLGLLLVKWTPPESLLLHVADGSVRFHVTYLNTFHHRWSVIQTPATSHRIQFDLSKDVKVRVYSLLKDPRTNGTEIKSTRYAEWTRTPGPGSPAVQQLRCVFHRMEYTECTWEHGSHDAPPTSLHSLYYWYGDLGATRECPQYINHNGTHRGCNFTRNQLPDFSLVSICVNCSSPCGASIPAYLYLKTHNHVKTAATEDLRIKVETGRKPQVQFKWRHPVGRVPSHCLQWEVEHSSDGPNGNQPTEKWIVSMVTSLSKPLSYATERACFRVRSKLADYCAALGIWSDWSQWKCHKENAVTDD